MSNFEKVIFKKVFSENLEITFWDSLKKTTDLRGRLGLFLSV